MHTLVLVRPQPTSHQLSLPTGVSHLHGHIQFTQRRKLNPHGAAYARRDRRTSYNVASCMLTTAPASSPLVHMRAWFVFRKRYYTILVFHLTRCYSIYRYGRPAALKRRFRPRLPRRPRRICPHPQPNVSCAALVGGERCHDPGPA